MSADEQLPIQPVENPILCSPYHEPGQHWLYDTKTGIPSKAPGRRTASYWFQESLPLLRRNEGLRMLEVES